MAEANLKPTSGVSLKSVFGRKEDEFCTIVMKIEDIANKIKTATKGESLRSDTLECGDIKFNIDIYPNGCKHFPAGDISIGVGIKNSGRRKWEYMEFLAAENSKGEFLERFTKTQAKLVEKNEVFGRKGFRTGLLTHSKVLAAENESYFPDGVLLVKVIIKVLGEETVTHKTTKPPSVTPAELKEELSADLRSMMESRKFTDFRIICQGEVIPCHRSVLSARSEIFEAMLEHDMKESETGEVEIKDFDLKTVKAIVNYMYTGEVEYAQDNSEVVMKAADKYGLEGLKKVIEDSLIEDIKTENAIDMFVLGDAVHAENLRDSAKAVIVSKAAAIVQMDGWREALGRFQDLTLEILESLAKKGAHA